MPTYSDDGQWWWDGHAWQPVTQQPPQQQPYGGQQYPGPQQPGGQPPYQGGPQGFYQPQQPQQPQRKSRTLLIVAGAVALVLIIAVGGVLVWNNNSGDSGGTAGGGPAGSDRKAGGAPPKNAKTLEPGQPVTAETLAEVDPQAFHEGVMMRQMVAPIGRLVSATFESEEAFASRRQWVLTDYAIDHKTDKYYYFNALLHAAPEVDKRPYNMMCVGTKQMEYSNVYQQWSEARSPGNKCTKKPYAGHCDSVVSSGLTADQADVVIKELRAAKGLVNPAKPTLLSANGKTYIRQVVDFNPVMLGDNSYYGSQMMMWAFKEAGLDPVTWPWCNPYHVSEGIHMVYYVDTETLRPAASFQRGTEAPGREDDADPVQVVNYSYPTTLPVSKLPKNAGTPRISLPEGWKLQ
ncbi:hypothetical protein ACFCV3_34770 [Kribbella sp. NPDC056345]|uniref:hypothetical protein n=1 Tax=Kribbella sp. NPDC056345 TaxID=3345789 RepID=UPI0035D86625